MATPPSASLPSPAARPPPLEQPWLDGGKVVLSFPLPSLVRCPVDGCSHVYGNQPQTALRHSLLRHLRSGYHAGLAICGTEWRCAVCGVALGRKVTAHKSPLAPPTRRGPAAALGVQHEWHWCHKWYASRRGLINHRQRCPRRLSPARRQSTDWAAALARIRGDSAPPDVDDATPPSASIGPSLSPSLLRAPPGLPPPPPITAGSWPAPPPPPPGLPSPPDVIPYDVLSGRAARPRLGALVEGEL